MFQKNDNALFSAKIILIVIIGILAVGSLVMGIVLAILIHGALFLTSLVGLLFCWLVWVFGRLYLSYLCDIKLIRNKLYGESNDDLEEFLKSNEKRSSSPATSPAMHKTKEERSSSSAIDFKLKALSDGTYEIVGVNNKLITDAVIPNNVTSIGYEAFMDCINLTNVTIPNGVTSIGARAFLCCGSLTNVTIPDGVTSIGYNAFLGCSSLTSITIPKNCKCGDSAFPDRCAVTRR